MIAIIILFVEKIVHSPTTLTIDDHPSALLVLSPRHGSISYKWERKGYSDEWSVVDVPGWTCLLYIDLPGSYRCTVEDNVVQFCVKGTCA